MPSNDIRNLLAEIVRLQANQGPLPSPVDNKLMTNAMLSPYVDPAATQSIEHKDIRGPSVVNRILDLMSRPLYSVANPIKEEVEFIKSQRPQKFSDITAAVASPEGPSIGEQVGAAARGFTGKDKTTGADIFEAAGAPKGLGRAGAGLAFDVALDPLTYTGVGLAKHLGRGVKKSIGALRGVEEASGSATQDLASELSRRAAQQSEVTRTPLDPVAGAPAPAAPPVPRSLNPERRASPGAPPRTFMAGQGTQPIAQLLPGPLGRAQRVGTPQLQVPPPRNFTPLDATSISMIKQSVSRGVPLEEAALRPLLPQEAKVLREGLESKSSRALEKELASATGRAVSKVFGAPTPTQPAKLSADQIRQVDELTAEKNRILAQIDDLEMQTSGTASGEVLAAETRRLETRLTELAPEIQRYRRELDRIEGTGDIRGDIGTIYDDLVREREQTLQRLSAIGEESLESGTVGPAGVTRTIINQEINKLEAESRKLGGQIERIRKGTPEVEVETVPREIPTTATASPESPIAVPTPRSKSVQNLIEEVSGIGINWRRMMQRQLSSIPEGTPLPMMIRILEAQKAGTNSPVFKNMIEVQLRKLREGVTPANLIETARTQAPSFPKISLSNTRRSAANDLADSFVRSNKYDEINHVGQTNLFNRIQSWVNKQKVPAKAKPDMMYQMLRVAEDRVLEQGKKLVDAEGYSVRLSDVANLAGGSKSLTTRLVDDFRSAKPVQAVESAKAATAAKTATEILDPVLSTARKAAQSARELPPSRTVQIGTDLSNALSQLARQAGASAQEADSAKKFMAEFFNPSKDDLYNEVMQQARALMRQTMTGHVDPILTNRISNAVYKSLQANPKVLGGEKTQHKVVEAIMMRFATWWNAKDLRPFAREYIDTARNVAAAFQKALTPLVRSTTPTQRTQAWRVVQGRIPAGNPEEAALAQRFQFLIENLMGASDVSQKAAAHSVLVRSGTTMADINKELPKRFQFRDTKAKDQLGREYDYRDGKWMHSWREWEVDEPAEALYQMTRAMQLATRKNAMLDDAAARWGVPTKGGEFSSKINADRIQDFYFPKPIADQMNTVLNRLDTDKFKPGNQAVQIFDKAQRMWKTGVTIYSPSHHIRNLNGDIFLAALDGVVTTSPYRKSMQAMHAFKGRYKDIENVFEIADPELRNAVLQAHPGKVLVTTKAGHKLTTEQVYQAAESQGFMLRAAQLEELVGGESVFGRGKISPFGGKLHQAAAGASETRDHFVRLAHFIDVLQKSKAKTLRDAITEAGQRVKKFHPDGSDLTGFEQNVMRRFIPFYSWLRKSSPLIIEGAIMRPHITLAFPKAMANMQEITGVESQGPGDPFPMDQMFPDWIKEKGIGPIIPPPPHPLAGIGRQQTWRGDAPGYVVVNPTNPFIDQIKEFGNPRQSAISNLTPAARIPIELLTGQNALGIPLSEVEGGTAGHLAQQIPPVGIGARITGMTRPEEPWHPEQLTNWLLTGGLVTGTGPYKSQAQFEIREHLAEMGKKERESRK